MSGATAEPRRLSQTTDDVEVAAIGAGQAGLAIGYLLKRQGRRFVILERADELAPAWHERWDSLTLFTPRRYSALPGLPFPGDPNGYPTRDEVITYLERYAETFELPARRTKAELREDGDGVGDLAVTSTASIRVNSCATPSKRHLAAGEMRPGFSGLAAISRRRPKTRSGRLNRWRVVDRAGWPSCATAIPASKMRSVRLTVGLSTAQASAASGLPRSA
jgi:NAD(P)-binding Rossmann-like domain